MLDRLMSLAYQSLVPLFQYFYQREKSQEATVELVNSCVKLNSAANSRLQQQYLNINTADQAFEVGTLCQESEDISL